jgi:hypothetical protein
VYTYMMHTIKLLFNYIYVGARRRVLVHSVIFFLLKMSCSRVLFLVKYVHKSFALQEHNYGSSDGTTTKGIDFLP